MDQLERHRRTFAVDRRLTRLAKTDFAQSIRLPADPEPLVWREPELELVVVAVIHHVEFGRLVVEPEPRKQPQRNFLGLCDVDGRLHVTGVADTRPVTGAAWSLLVGVRGFALVGDSTGEVHVDRMQVLPRSLRKLRYLGRGGCGAGEDQH